MSTLRPALVIAAHGSKATGWSDAVEAFARDVHASVGVRDAFSSVQPAFLDHDTPSVPGAVRMSLSSGCSEVLVVPLFLTVSTHASEDLPGLLGLPVPEHVRQRLHAEGHRPLAPGLPVRIAPLGDVEEILIRNVLRRLSLHTKTARDEAVVLVGYGSTIHHEKWETLMHGLRTRLLTHGYGHATHAYVGQVAGHSPNATAQAILSAGRIAGVKRVHVVPLLMSVSGLQTQTIAVAVKDAAKRGRLQVIYPADAILPDGDLAAHVAMVALQRLGLFPQLRAEGVEA